MTCQNGVVGILNC